MAGRRTNVALLVLLLLALATGLAAFGIGTGWARPVLVVHGMAAFAIVALTPWKAAIAGRGLRRTRPGRWLSILLTATVAMSVVSGVAFSTGLILSYGPLTAMQVHVGSAFASIALGALHMIGRPQRVRGIDVDRRTLLRSAGLATVAGLFYVAAEGAQGVFGLDGANRRFTGSHERGSFDPAAMPVTSWINDRTPVIDRDSYHLVLRDRTGVRTVPLAEIGAGTDSVTATLDCTGGWFATQQWRGTRLDRLIDPDAAGSVRVISATGYERRLPISAAQNLLIATHAGGAPLSAGHGAPVRLVVPGRRGFWWVKWVSEVVVDDRPSWWQPPFPIT